jgi:hypothetical protein
MLLLKKNRCHCSKECVTLSFKIRGSFAADFLKFVGRPVSFLNGLPDLFCCIDDGDYGRHCAKDKACLANAGHAEDITAPMY